VVRIEKLRGRIEMTDAWKEQRDAVARRNAQAQKRGQDKKESRATMDAAHDRAVRAREAEQLRNLNAQIDKRQARGAR
jgi:hypothetical protein